MSKEIDEFAMNFTRMAEVIARAQSMAQGHNYAGMGGEVAIRSAVVMGDIDGVERVIRHGTDINTVINPDGDTPLTKSILGGQTDLAIWLIEHGADIEKPLKNGRTPLITAAGKGNVRVVEKLIESGAKLDTAMSNGSTALMYAIGKGFEDIAKRLVDAGASVDLKDNEGWGIDEFARISGMDVSELHRRGENHSGFGEPRIEHRVGDRHSCFVGYFRENPLGRYPHDMTVLSLLPPVDRCLILEMVLFFGFCDRIVAVDKLSMAYFKAGWEDVAFRFLESCYRGQLLNYGEYSYFMDKLDGLPVHGVSEDYDDTLRKLPQYYIPGDPFCELLKAFCEKYRGDDVLASLNLNLKEHVTDMQDFLRDRLRFCDALERKPEHLGRD